MNRRQELSVGLIVAVVGGLLAAIFASVLVTACDRRVTDPPGRVISRVELSSPGQQSVRITIQPDDEDLPRFDKIRRSTDCQVNDRYPDCDAVAV